MTNHLDCEPAFLAILLFELYQLCFLYLNYVSYLQETLFFVVGAILFIVSAILQAIAIDQSKYSIFGSGDNTHVTIMMIFQLIIACLFIATSGVSIAKV